MFGERQGRADNEAEWVSGMKVRGLAALLAGAMTLLLATEASAAVRTYAYSAKVGGAGVFGDRGAELWLSLGISPGDMVSFEATFDDAAPVEMTPDYAGYSSSSSSLRLNGRSFWANGSPNLVALGVGSGIYRFGGTKWGVLAPDFPGNSRIDFQFDVAAPMLPGFALPATLPAWDTGTLGFSIWDDERWGTVEYRLVDWTAVTTSVPEPTTWALLIAGFGMAGGMVRLRRRGAAKSADCPV